MGYMDVPAKGRPNGHTVVLLHGKNFCGATWETTIAVLSGAGYRVVVPDLIGFCSSTKPAHYQYSFQQLAPTPGNYCSNWVCPVPYWSGTRPVGCWRPALP